MKWTHEILRDLSLRWVSDRYLILHSLPAESHGDAMHTLDIGHPVQCPVMYMVSLHENWSYEQWNMTSCPCSCVQSTRLRRKMVECIDWVTYYWASIYIVCFTLTKQYTVMSRFNAVQNVMILHTAMQQNLNQPLNSYLDLTSDLWGASC